MGIQINGQTDTVTATDGSINVGGDVTIPGVLTYEDVTNVDSVGIVTAQSGIHVTGGGFILNQQRSDTHASLIIDKPDAGTGTLKFFNNGSASAYIQHTGAEHLHYYLPSGSGYHAFYTNGSNERLRIKSNGEIRQENSGGSTIYELQRTDSNTTGSVGTVNFTASDGHSVASMSAMGDGDNEGAHLVFRTTSAAANNSPYNAATPERLRITSAGQMGLGTNDPNSYGGSVKLAVANTSGTCGLSIVSATNGDGNLYYADGTSGDATYRGYIRYNHTLDQLRIGVAGAERLRIDDDGRVLVGPGAIATPKCGHAGIDIPNNDWAIIMGGSDGNGNRANNANKDGRFAGAHYVNAEEPVGIIRCTSGASANELHMGGGTSLVNAATQISLYTAANTTTTGGTERLRITSGGNIGINCNSPGSMLELNAAAGTKMGISLGAVGDNITASRYIGICKTADQTDLGANSGFSGIEFGGPSSTNEGYLAFHTHDLGVESGERIRLTKDGKFGVGLTAPESKVQIRDTTSIGKDTYATANTGGSQTPPPGTFKWDNVTPVAGHGRGYEAWVQSGDAYPNASNYIDVLIRNAGFYRITLKRSHSSAEAAVCQMMIYGLANSGNSNYPVVHMNGAMGSGTSTATVQSGNGRGSSNAVASFYWEIHSYNVNTHDTIIRITTTGSNNQGIVALIEQI